MKERGILFSEPMVRAILDGSKTQTRRVLTPQPELAIMDAESANALCVAQDVGVVPNADTPRWRWRGCFYMPWPQGVRHDSPYGMCGDRLWVRETWAPADSYAFGPPDRDPPQAVAYRADQTAVVFGGDLEPRQANTYGWRWESMKWKPSIFMPRWASRITLEVTEVRVQRVQEITEEDAHAEGITELDGWLDEVELCRAAKKLGGCPEDARTWFAVLWDSINGKRPGCAWADNPWVFAISFRRLQP